MTTTFMQRLSEVRDLDLPPRGSDQLAGSSREKTSIARKLVEDLAASGDGATTVDDVLSLFRKITPADDAELMKAWLKVVEGIAVGEGTSIGLCEKMREAFLIKQKLQGELQRRQSKVAEEKKLHESRDRAAKFEYPKTHQEFLDALR